MPEVYCTITFCEYVYGVSADAFYSMIHCGFGVRDFANRTKTETAELYIPTSFWGVDANGVLRQVPHANLPLAYSYDENLGAFIADDITPTHAKAYQPYIVQCGGKSVDAYVETQNIQFIAEKFVDKAINIFLKLGIGIGSYIARFITASNYRFADNSTLWPMGSLNETASFDATTIRMNGNRKYKVTPIATDHPVSDCIRFRIDAVPRDGQWRVFDIEMRSAGLVTEVTESADG